MSLVAITVVLAGGIGALARYLVSLAFASRRSFPWAVLVVNVIGSALGGVALGLGTALDPATQLILVTGFAGGLTTFSTFGVETVQLVIDGRWRTAVASVTGNLGLGTGAAALAFLVTSA